VPHRHQVGLAGQILLFQQRHRVRAARGRAPPPMIRRRCPLPGFHSSGLALLNGRMRDPRHGPHPHLRLRTRQRVTLCRTLRHCDLVLLHPRSALLHRAPPQVNEQHPTGKIPPAPSPTSSRSPATGYKQNRGRVTQPSWATEQGQRRRPIAPRSLPSPACRWLCRPDTGHSPDEWSQPGSWSFSVTGRTNDLGPRAHAPIRAPVQPMPKRHDPRRAPTPGRSPTVRRSNPPSPIRCRIWRWPGACYLWLWPVLAGVRYLVTIQFVCRRPGSIGRPAY
jgi:hypothetical protein